MSVVRDPHIGHQHPRQGDAVFAAPGEADTPVDERAGDEIADVLVVGGGLAGLSVALDIMRSQPDVDAAAQGSAADPAAATRRRRIVVIERNHYPLPEAAHKVGESTVEIGAHYFADVLGERTHLENEQLPKFGFRFFFTEGREDIDQVTELGGSRVLPTGSFQIDRGRFENYLSGRAAESGIEVLAGRTVRELVLSDGGREPHRIRMQEPNGGERWLRAHWLVDASGRQGLLKRQLGLARGNDHDVGSVWFRIDHRIDPERWSQDSDWLGRCDGRRWLSTNHLCGPGYWVWLIPLASGAHSVGIVADNRIHPIRSMRSFETAMQWLAVHQPRLWREIDGVRDRLLDFRVLTRFSYDCERLFDGHQRWAITGESGLFLDPFYSPGSDYIAIANGFITDLINREERGERIGARAELYQRLMFQLARNHLSLYQNQYPIFGDARVLPLKVLWDYCYYWGIVCPLVFRGMLTDLRLMGRLSARLDQIGVCNAAVQRLLLRWTEQGPHDNPPCLLDQADIPWFTDLNRQLTEALDATALEQRIADNDDLMQRLAAEIVATARADGVDCDDPALARLPAVDPRAPSLLTGMLAERLSGQSSAKAPTPVRSVACAR